MTDRPRLHHWDGTRMWASRGMRILTGPAPLGPFTVWARLGWRRAGGGEWWRRLSRRGIHHVLHLHGDTVLVVLRRRLLVMAGGRILRDHATSLGSQPRPRGVCRMPDGRILYGEYGPNPRRDPVRLMLSADDGASWQTAWRSAAGEIRHIHMVCPVAGDPGSVFVATGDYGAEPRLLKLDLDTRDPVVIGGGDQAWRMLALIQDGNRLIWGSDNDRGENHIYELSPGEREPRVLHPLPGPAYAACRYAGGGMVVATAVEDRRRHRACILVAENGKGWRVQRCFPKDRLPARLFGYGVADFPLGQDELPLLPPNLKGLLRERGTA